MHRHLTGALWIALYLLLALWPLLLFFVAGPAPRDFWTEASVALAFVGLSMLLLQFVLTARFGRVAAPFGVDMMLQFHRQISLVAVGMITAHVVIILAIHAEPVALLNVLTGSWAPRAGLIALVALLAMVALSIWRKPWRISYEAWRASHIILALAVLGFGMWHVVAAGDYLDSGWNRGVWIAMAAAAAGLLAWIRIGRPARMKSRPWIVEEVRPERDDVWTLRLRPQGHAGMRFRPGQFAWLTLDRSPFAIREHPFSFSSSSEEGPHVEFGIKALGDFTRTVQDVPPGTRAYLDGPFGVFTPDRFEDGPLVLVAGGIGITPFISMLRSLADRGDRRTVLLLYGSQTWQGITYREALDRLKDQLDLHVVHVLEEPPDGWTGETGFVDEEVLDRHLPKPRAKLRVFLCGPPPMMESVQDALHRLGVPLEQTHLEYFDLV